MGYRSVALCVGAVLAGLGVGPIAAADAQTLGPLIAISGGDPVASCTTDRAAGQSGTNFGGTAVEPWIAVDPTRTGHLLTGVQQDRWSNGGSRALRAAVSTDGGRHWANRLPRGTSACAGAHYQRTTDPWTAFGADGTAYFFSLLFNDANANNALVVNRSTDGGVTWQNPVTLIADTDPLAFNDKNSLTVDPLVPGNVYAVWDRLYGPASAFRAPGGSDDRAYTGAATFDGMDRARAHRSNRKLAAATTPETFGPTYFARSTDSGATWTRAVPIYDPGPNAQTVGNVIVVQPSGELLDFFTLIDAMGNGSISFVRSLDHGLSWTTTAEMATVLTGDAPVTPDSQQAMRSEDIIFSVANDPADGTLHLVMQLAPSAGAPVQVVYLQSRDDGKTWSAPVVADRTPANVAVPLRGQAFNGNIGVGPNGALVLTYYDFRNDTGVGGEFADAWAVICKRSATVSCTMKADWAREWRLTLAPFDITQAPLTDSGYFLGDYFGVIGQGKTVWPAFTAVTGPHRTGLFTRAIQFP